jgi:tryptophan 2,3-dioxygenase
MEKGDKKPLYYNDYLQLDKILGAQDPESDKGGIRADDEMLFIIIHQAYELWFKQILHELNIVREIFKKPNIPNNSPDIYNSVHRIKRVCRILDITVMQLGVLETMTPLDFLDFRDLLRPASGFQSIQFKIIEATLGLKYKSRYGQDYYISHLKPDDVKRVREAEQEESLLVLFNKWLERMPYVKDDSYWKKTGTGRAFWNQYREAYANSLLEGEKQNLETFDRLLMNDNDYPEDRSFSPAANRAALFIMIYRDYPLLHLPYELISSLLEIDELLSMWRHRHIHMVQRTIGKRVGTGGSSGAEYLRSAAESHIIFKELAELTSFLVSRRTVPVLPEELAHQLNYK